MNKVILLGRICNDINIRHGGAKNTAIANFNLAVNRKMKLDNQPSADFIRCVAFGKTAENIEKYFKKGKQIAVSGRWQTDNYTNKDGAKVYTNDCVVEEFDFVGNKNDSDDGDNDSGFYPTDNNDELPFT